MTILQIIVLLSILLWIILGMFAARIILKDTREERFRKQGSNAESKYNTVGDYFYASFGVLGGIITFMVTLLITYEDKIVKRYDK
jgi:uncharacterized membrane protein YfcA